MLADSSSHFPRAITYAGMYYHSLSGDPLYRTIPPGEECVEVMVGGRGWLRHEGELVEVTAGHLIWHIPGDQTVCRSDPGDPYRCMCLRFESASRHPRRYHPHLSQWENDASARQFCEQVIAWYVDESIDRQGLLHSVYGTLLMQIRQRVGIARRQKLPMATQRVLMELETNYARPYTLAEVAQRVGWSVSHLHAEFKRQIGTTPYEIVQRRRLRAAMEMLAGSDMQMKEIAAACGYSSAAAFGHTFRQRTGETPRAWRRRKLGLDDV
ncbi:AraC family transcriptional regulator [Ruficoccus sp. ZRK36]|uniref:helix-turn-helix transcriptional regulator n=1 Tax=Ruficoccus sp. ZRK36 TaxID=2866311 RepID=UPI001C7390FC|nr:AraC family transcriptional regulator [Ruficoccus sp. ZRK36]QYY35217.1 AraC family transcriptional regulator [Ruficoccus sp. ZRK36]